jgi:hypothetical protein
MTSLAERANRTVSAGCALIAAVAVGDLAIRAAVRLETRWDELVYHLPFAALRGGLAIPYDMNEEMYPWYQGYPPLPHLLQGVLWRLTGSINATGIVCYLALLAFLAFCHLALRAKFWLVALIALTAPMVLIHATVSYIDLIGNSFLAIGFSSCLYLYLFPERPSRLILLGGLAGLVLAAWSKYPMVPLVAVALGIFALLGLSRGTTTGLSRRQTATLLVLAAVLAALPYLKNLYLYQNPFWPLRIPVAPDLFPYAVDIQNSSSDLPPPLQQFGHVSLFIRSLFEIGHPTHYDYRPRWIIDQGNAWIAFRSGGFWGAGVAFYLLATAGMLVVHDRRKGIVATIALLGLLSLVAVLPQSYELRYYLFIPLLWAAAIGMTFPKLRQVAPRTALCFLVTVLGLFSYMASENDVYYQTLRLDYRTAALNWGAPYYWDKMQRGKTYCAVGMAPIGIFLTGPTMSEFRIFDRTTEALCPDDSIVLTMDGAQYRKGGAW